jgi:hypothetical protein
MDLGRQIECSISTSDAQVHLEPDAAGSLNKTQTSDAGGYMKLSKAVALLFGALVLISSFLLRATAEQTQSTISPSPTSPVPEMERLAKALLGDWNTTETMEQGDVFPNGGSRRGIVHVKLAAGGTTLIYEVHSDGSAGKLDGMLVIWWDKNASLYRVFVCFNNPRHPCEMRGTARWEGDSFVNDYEDVVKGRKTSWRDTFTFAPNSHTLVAAMRAADGAMQTQITTKATRLHPVW